MNTHKKVEKSTFNKPNQMRCFYSITINITNHKYKQKASEQIHTQANTGTLHMFLFGPWYEVFFNKKEKGFLLRKHVVSINIRNREQLSMAKRPQWSHSRIHTFEPFLHSNKKKIINEDIKKISMNEKIQKNIFI